MNNTLYKRIHFISLNNEHGIYLQTRVQNCPLSFATSKYTVYVEDAGGQGKPDIKQW